ncbi:MAG: cytochrome P460 family protein [Acidobacteria bacterium]|nr:cytochrome P460 family protein [Acidobacteriota bacterium]
MRRLKLTFALTMLVAGALAVVGRSQNQVFAPIVDRIGFPVGYQTTFTHLYTFDHFQNRQIRVAYANDLAANVKPGQPYPYGSIIVGEFYPALRDAQGEPVLDENGRFIQGGAPTIFVMRKEVGFGVAYGPFRNGEWEYVSYRPDGTYASPPERTGAGSCAECHQTAGRSKDFVFRANLHFANASGAVPDAVIKNYRFIPATITVKPGRAITVYNDDDTNPHTFTANNGSFDSGLLNSGDSFSVALIQPGRIDVHCNNHNRESATIVVQP